MAAAVHDSHLALTHRATHDPLTGLANRAALDGAPRGLLQARDRTQVPARGTADH